MVRFLNFFLPKCRIFHYLFVLRALPIASSLIYAPLSVAYSLLIPYIFLRLTLVFYVIGMSEFYVDQTLWLT